MIFLCQTDISSSKWSIDFASSNLGRIQLGLADSTPTVMQGEYGMLAWLANQAFQRRCATENDFVFLYAESLLRPAILGSSTSLEEILCHIADGDVDTDWTCHFWSRAMTNIMTCRDTIETLPSWIDDLCLEAMDNGQTETRARISRQYEQKIQSQERVMNVIKHKLDIAFATRGGEMASESISETKLVKSVWSV